MRALTAVASFPLAFALMAPAQAQEVLTGTAAFGSAAKDAPGVRRHITPADLPAPSLIENDHEEPDFKRLPEVVDAPEGKLPAVPEGFTVQVFARDLKEPRVIRIAPNGDIFVSDAGTGRVLVYEDSTTANPEAKPKVFAEGLDRPFGIAFYPPDKPQFVYVAAADQVVRYPYSEDNAETTGPAETIIADIPTQRHWTRDLVFSRDGKQLFVSIGSASNVADTMPDKTRDEIKDIEAKLGVGAAWGDEENRAVVRVTDAGGKNVRNFATGLRNCSGMTLQPNTDTLWCTGNERDHVGPNLVPDFLTTVQEGGFYGWPWYYIGANEDPAHKGQRPDLKDKVLVPDVLLQAHSSTLQLTFYDGDAFPAEYQGDIFATLRGSWNREDRTGYKVIRALMKDGKPTGVYEDFMTGFVLDEDKVWGRPAGIAVTQDGALLVSEDANGVIYKVTAAKK